MSQRSQIYLLVGLLVVLAITGYYALSSRSAMPGLSGVVTANTNFEPLDVQEPSLRIDELEKLRKQEPSGSHRNIFVAAPPPPPRAATTPQEAQIVGDPFPKLPPPPPPLQVPVEFFGFASQASSGKRVAFFTSGDDVLVVAEGDKFLNNYRLIHIGNESADVEEIATGRHQTLQLVQAPEQGGAANQ